MKTIGWTTVASGVIAASLLAGCAGDMKDARKAAGTAATFVSDMQQTTLDAIDEQQRYRQGELNRATELQVAAQLNQASVNQYSAIWQAEDDKNAQAIYKAASEMISDADLTKTAPFVILAPLPDFTAPTVDRKTFNDLIANFNKLSQGLSPIDRAMALKPFIEVVVKSFGDDVKNAKKATAPKTDAQPVAKELVQAVATAKGAKSSTGVSDFALSMSPEKIDIPAQAPVPPAELLKVEALTENTEPVNGLMSALGAQ
jgi:hypothetical protein